MNHNILIVEDNYLIAYELELLLQKQGYQVKTCAYGEEAVEITRQNISPPDLYIMDVGLKGKMNGIVTAESIKNINPEAKFIFMSGNEDKIHLNKNTDINNFLEKPFDTEDLLSLVKRNYQNHIQSTQNTPTMKNLRILIVEDDRGVAEVLENKIERRLKPSVHVDICAYAEEAVERAKNPDNAPHLYLMDIKLMGNMDGLEAASQIKEITPNAQFIFMSGHETKFRVAKEQGVVILLPKPVEPDDMLKEILKTLPTLEFFFKPYILKNSVLVYKNDAETGRAVERIRIKAEDILVLKTGGGTTTIYTKDGKKYFIVAGLTALMNKWNERAARKELPNSLHRINANFAVNMENFHKYGTECGIVIAGYNDDSINCSNEESGSRFINLSERYCPYFKGMLVHLASG